MNTVPTYLNLIAKFLFEGPLASWSSILIAYQSVVLAYFCTRKCLKKLQLKKQLGFAVIIFVIGGTSIGEEALWPPLPSLATPMTRKVH